MVESDQIHADLRACNRALDELVSTIVMYDLNEEAQHRRHLLLKLYPATTGADYDRMAFRSRVTDPVRMALREAVRKIGIDIHRLSGSRDGMLDSYHAVCDMDPNTSGRRAAIIDSAWNGVGSDRARWWS